MEEFYEAFINTSHKVLGENLKPFCLLHYLYLESIGSPLINIINGETVDLTKKDLALACIVCASNSDNIVERISSISFFNRIRLKFYSFKKAQKNFVSYIKDYVTSPEMWENSESKGEKLGSHWILSRLVFLMQNTTFSEKEIWEMGLGKVLWYSASLGEILGGAKIMSAEEIGILDEVKRG